MANFKVHYIVFVITQLKVPLQQKHTEKFRQKPSAEPARRAAPHPKQMMLQLFLSLKETQVCPEIKRTSVLQLKCTSFDLINMLKQINYIDVKLRIF